MPKVHDDKKPFLKVINTKNVVSNIDKTAQKNPNEFNNFYVRMTHFFNGHTTMVSVDNLTAFQKEARKQFKQLMDFIDEKKAELKEQNNAA